MAVFLKAILAIYLLVEIVSTTPLRQPGQIDNNKFKKYVFNLNKSLGPACKSFKCAEERVRKIQFDHNDKTICQTYSTVFLDVRCVLDKVAESNPTECNETVSAIQPHPELYNNQTNCNLPNNGDMLMKEFCSKLQKYVSNLYAICVKN